MRDAVFISREGDIGNGSWATYFPSLDCPPDSAEEVLIHVRDGLAEKCAKVRAQWEDERLREAERNRAIKAERDEKLAKAAALMAADPGAIPDLPYGITQQEYPEVMERKRRIKAKEDRQKQAQAEAAEAKRVFIRTWLEAHGTSDQVERFDAGVLPEREYLDAMKDHAFGALNQFPRYENISAVDVHAAVEATLSEEERDSGLYQGCKAQYRSTDAAELNAEQWKALKAIHTALPEATVVPKRHEGTLDHNDVPWGVVTRHGAVAIVMVGPIEVRREYALPS